MQDLGSVWIRDGCCSADKYIAKCSMLGLIWALSASEHASLMYTPDRVKTLYSVSAPVDALFRNAEALHIELEPRSLGRAVLLDVSPVVLGRLFLALEARAGRRRSRQERC